MLKIYKNSTDISLLMENYSVDEFSTLLLSTDEILIGYYKPINSMYLELGADKNLNTSAMSLYYYNGTSFVTTPTLVDETKGFSRCGFIKWSRNLPNEKTTTEQAETMYWYKIKVDVDTSILNLLGINLVFSNDNDLKEEYPSIMEMLPENEPTFIKFHVASRKDILSYFRAQGKLIKVNDKNYATSKKLDQFDLLDYEELRDASKFLTLSKILYWVSDSVDDKWHQKALKYEQKYGDKINLVNLSIDSNDDGKADNNETNAIQSITIVRQ